MIPIQQAKIKMKIKSQRFGPFEHFRVIYEGNTVLSWKTPKNTKILTPKPIMNWLKPKIQFEPKIHKEKMSAKIDLPKTQNLYTKSHQNQPKQANFELFQWLVLVFWRREMGFGSVVPESNKITTDSVKKFAGKLNVRSIFYSQFLTISFSLQSICVISLFFYECVCCVPLSFPHDFLISPYYFLLISLCVVYI